MTVRAGLKSCSSSVVLLKLFASGYCLALKERPRRFSSVFFCVAFAIEI